MRIVLDTNILVRANAKARGPARELLQLIVGSRDHVLLLSPFLLHELERVFSYQRVRTSSKLTDGEVVEYLSYLRAKDVSEIVYPGPLLVLCLPTLMTTQWSTPRLWDAPMPSVRSTGISSIRWSAATVVNVAF